MQKIMFNDKYGLTKAVLDGHKTQTRRIIPTNLYNSVDWQAFEEGNYDCIIDPENPYITDIRDYAAYKVGEEVAIAQSYFDCGYTANERRVEIIPGHVAQFSDGSAGWSNKMFVRADLMPHRIKITDIRVQRLQDIEHHWTDCLSEGVEINEDDSVGKTFYIEKDGVKEYFSKATEAFSTLIDKVSGKGTWESNPYVFVYDFELIK